MFSPKNEKNLGLTDAELCRRNVRARMNFERMKVTVASIITIIVMIGAIILAKWPHVH